MLERERGGRWCRTGGCETLPKAAARSIGTSHPTAVPPRHPRPPGGTRGGDTAPELPDAAGTTAGSQGGGWEFGDAPRAAHPWPRGPTHPRSCASRNSPSTNRQLPKTEGKVWRGEKRGGNCHELKNSSPCLPWQRLRMARPGAGAGRAGAEPAQRDRGREGQSDPRSPSSAPRSARGSRVWGLRHRSWGGKSQFRAIP